MFKGLFLSSENYPLGNMNFIVFWPICQHTVDLQPLEETDVTFSAEKCWNTSKDFFFMIQMSCY